MADRKTIRLFPKDDNAAAPPGELAHLSDLRDYEIADPAPDIRGWTIKLRDGRTLGKVDDLIVDTDHLVVKFLEVKLAREYWGADDVEWMLVPIGAARLDEENDTVVVDRLPAGGLENAPRSRRGEGPRVSLTTPEALVAASSWEPLTSEGGAIEEISEERPIEQ